MKFKEIGTASFQLVEFELDAGESFYAEPGAMASQDVGIQPEPLINGSLLQALALKFFGGESFFINLYRNIVSTPQKIYLTQSTPGDIQSIEIKDEEIFLEQGSFIARTEGIRIAVKWAGFRSFIAGEGLFKLSFMGQGRIWYGCYGAVVEKEVQGSLIVDSGHLLMWPATIKRSLALPGGIFSSFFSKEGFVMKLEGHGKIQLQTRSVNGLAQWLNSKFW